MSSSSALETHRPDVFDAFIEAAGVFVDRADPALFPDFRSHTLDLLRRMFVNGMLALSVQMQIVDSREFVLAVWGEDDCPYPESESKPLWLTIEVLERAFLLNNFDGFSDQQLAELIYHPWLITHAAAEIGTPEWTVKFEEQELRLDPLFAQFNRAAAAMYDWVEQEGGFVEDEGEFEE